MITAILPPNILTYHNLLLVKEEEEEEEEEEEGVEKCGNVGLLL
jgi:hypothetical protein